MMHSIRIQITIITIVAILTSILMVFMASFLIIQNETDKNSVGMMNLIDQDTEKSLEKYFESIEQSVEIAANIAIENMDSVFLVECGAVHAGTEEVVQTEAQKQELEAYLQDYCATIQTFFSGVADYTQGVTAYYYCISPKISENRQGFYYRKIGKTGFIRQEPFDVTALKPVESLHATWYEKAEECGRPVWIGPYIADTDQKEWICTYFVPIYKAGMLIGLMGMDIPCDTLIAQVSDVPVYDTGYTVLTDAEGRVIYHPELPIGSELSELGLTVDQEILKDEKSGDELIRYSAGSEARQMSFSTLSNGMKLACVAPAREINAPWIRMIRISLLIAVLVIAFYAVLIYLIMRVITQPLQQLTEASKRLADADYDVDLDYHHRNEIGTLTGAFSRMRDQLRQYIDDLNHQIYHDRLTDLPNMRYFFTLARDVRDSMVEAGQKPAMVYFNIVGLRYYNRQYGFEKGDELLVEFSGILSRQFGSRRVCRLSGDQFAAVTDEENADVEIQAVIREWESGADERNLPLCVGIYPNRLGDVDVNVACDRAKYAADQNKDEHASTVTFFDQSMLKTAEIYLHIIQNLDRALQEGWIKVYYQPIIRAADGKVCDEEALARWIDPIYGFLSPADFIPALEESKLIYKLDCYVLEQVLDKMKRQKEAGVYMVPQSINLSRMDFERCDVVEEFRSRVDAAGIDRSMISVEITESVIGSDFDFMKEQVARFRELGFPVWMDDFGSGYSSLDVLQQIHFDLLKFDMRFMENFNEGDESKIILTELMNMAIGLDSETVCEGVETAEQVEFLREVGCTRIQGYYYGRPMPYEGVGSQTDKKNGLEYENPEEAGYYASIGRINLYDLSALGSDSDEALNQYFNTLPMCILEVKDNIARYNRCNRSYRDFLERTMGIPYSTEPIDCTEILKRAGATFMKSVVQCSKEGGRTIIDERIDKDTITHTLIRRVAVNPVTGTAAVAAAVLAIIKQDSNDGTNYSQMAKALASDYVDLYYVNLETERYIQYSPNSEEENLAMERHGEDFFTSARKEALERLYKDDQEHFVQVFTKEKVVEQMDAEGKFTETYRLMMDGEPVYVDMKAVRVPEDPSHIIVGVSNVDAAMRQEEATARLQAEKAAYSRMSALSRGFICIYNVDPKTGHYIEYRASNDYEGLGVPKEGDDFWAQTKIEGEKHAYPEDLPKFQSMINREAVMKNVEKGGVYRVVYRLVMDGQPRLVSFKATYVEEQGEKVLIVGVNDISDQTS